MNLITDARFRFGVLTRELVDRARRSGVTLNDLAATHWLASALNHGDDPETVEETFD